MKTAHIIAGSVTVVGGFVGVVVQQVMSRRKKASDEKEKALKLKEEAVLKSKEEAALKLKEEEDKDMFAGKKVWMDSSASEKARVHDFIRYEQAVPLHAQLDTIQAMELPDSEALAVALIDKADTFLKTGPTPEQIEQKIRTELGQLSTKHVGGMAGYAANNWESLLTDKDSRVREWALRGMNAAGAHACAVGPPDSEYNARTMREMTSVSDALDVLAKYKEETGKIAETQSREDAKELMTSVYNNECVAHTDRDTHASLYCLQQAANGKCSAPGVMDRCKHTCSTLSKEEANNMWNVADKYMEDILKEDRWK